MLANKYADHLPLYRQSQIFERDGLDLDRSTLADWVEKSTALLAPLADAIGRHVLAAGAIFADDTPVRMLAPGTGRTQTARLGPPRATRASATKTEEAISSRSKVRGAI